MKDHWMTFEEIGDVLGVKGATARKLEAKALRKLRQPHRSLLLRPFFESGTVDHPWWFGAVDGLGNRRKLPKRRCS